MRGGVRDGAGRKKLDSHSKLQARKVYLSQEQIQRIEEVGVGDTFSQKAVELLLTELNRRTLLACSLYCGCGGLDLGFKQAGIHTLWATDLDKDCCNTYRFHSPNTTVIQGDIANINTADMPSCDILLGGPPCQGFSIAGKRSINDPRNQLYKHYVRIISEKQTKVFIFENVKGLLSMNNGEVLKQIIEDFEGCGYTVFYQLLDAKDYGVPQHRERVIITGFRKDLGIKDFVIPPYTGKPMTIGDALKGLPEPSAADIYNASYSSWYMRRNRRREYNDVSHTILASAKYIPIWSGSPAMVKIHSESWVFGEGGVTRRFSWQEASAIQTFPTDMVFEGKLVSRYRQIGNAVPPKLAEHIATAIKALLLSR